MLTKKMLIEDELDYLLDKGVKIGNIHHALAKYYQSETGKKPPVELLKVD